jgi:hypothetical protein
VLDQITEKFATGAVLHHNKNKIVLKKTFNNGNNIGMTKLLKKTNLLLESAKCVGRCKTLPGHNFAGIFHPCVSLTNKDNSGEATNANLSEDVVAGKALWNFNLAFPHLEMERGHRAEASQFGQNLLNWPFVFEGIAGGDGDMGIAQEIKRNGKKKV